MLSCIYIHNYSNLVEYYYATKIVKPDSRIITLNNEKINILGQSGVFLKIGDEAKLIGPYGEIVLKMEEKDKK